MSTTPQASESGSGHERRDVDVFSLGLIAVAMLVCGIMIHLTVGGLMHFLNEHRHRGEPLPTNGESQPRFAEPRLQADPENDFAAFAAQQKSERDSYGWIDQPKGVVRIPVARAMDLLLERGLPEVGAGETPLSMMQARPVEKQSVPKRPAHKP